MSAVHAADFNVPKGEILMTTYWNDGVCHHVITTKGTREYYYLYKNDGGKLAKIAKAQSPVELEQKYLNGGKAK